MRKKFIVIFAGPPGSSKTPISNYLSTLFNLPVFNNDAIRSEVIEDKSFLDEEEQVKRRDERLNKILALNNSFILDASVDRVLGQYVDKIDQLGYGYFVISLDLSKEFLISLYKAKEYGEFINNVDKTLSEHDEFLNRYGNLVNIHITDRDFPNRLEICAEKLSGWLSS